MDDSKNKILITIVAVCWAFILCWWLLPVAWYWGLILSSLVAAIVGGAAWFAVDLLS